MLELLKNPSALLVVLMNLDGNCHPDVGSLTLGCGQVFATNDAAAFRKAFLTYVDECWFDVFVAKLQVAYMGTTRPSSTLNDLMKCKMHGWNGKEAVRLSVLDHFPKFMQCVEMLDQGSPYATNICALYQGVWYTELQNFANTKDYTVPPQPLNETNATAHAWLQQV